MFGRYIETLEYYDSKLESYTKVEVWDISSSISKIPEYRFVLV